APELAAGLRHLLQRGGARLRHREPVPAAGGRFLRAGRPRADGRPPAEPASRDPVLRLLRGPERAHVPDRQQRRPQHPAIRGSLTGTGRETMRRQRIRLALVVVLLALGAAVPASAQDVLRLAIVAEVTGGGAPSGTMWRDGVILAAEELSKKGGILGRRVETSVMDTQSDPPTSVAVMRRAVNEKPFAVMGTVYSSSTVANMEIARQAGIPQI